MKFTLCLAGILPIALLEIGCTPRPHATAAAEDSDGRPALFKAGKGMVMSPESKQLFGVELVDAEERSMHSRFHRTAQIYQAADSNNPARAIIRFTREEVARLSIGMEIRLARQPDEPRPITGHLTTLDDQTHSLFNETEGLVELEDQQQHFKEGDYLLAELEGDPGRKLVIPETALLNAADGFYVYAANGTHLTRVCVKPGKRSEGWVEIEEGLYAGDSVMAKGVEGLWLVELSAIKGGKPCCPTPRKDAVK